MGCRGGGRQGVWSAAGEDRTPAHKCEGGSGRQTWAADSECWALSPLGSHSPHRVGPRVLLPTLPRFCPLLARRTKPHDASQLSPSTGPTKQVFTADTNNRAVESGKRQAGRRTDGRMDRQEAFLWTQAGIKAGQGRKTEEVEKDIRTVLF